MKSQKRPRKTLHCFFKPVDSSTLVAADVHAETESPTYPTNATTTAQVEADVATAQPETEQTILATRFERDPGKCV
jgi:septal ring-binding cell division protein DamX